MPSSTLGRPRTRAKASDWVVIVPGQQPDDRPEPAQHAVAVAAPAVVRPAALPRIPTVVRRADRSVAFQEAVARLAPMALMVAATAAVLWMVLGRDPLLTLGVAKPHFVAYQEPTAEQVRYVLNDGWTQTAAVPGAMLMDWRADRVQPALRMTFGNPAAEPEVERVSADGTRIEEIRYRGSWPGIDTVLKGMPGGWMAVFVVEPGLSPGMVELEYVGATELKIDQAGRLVVKTENGTFANGTPESWQEGPAGREPVETRYELRGGTRFGFILGSYDPSRPLFVDPPGERIE